MSRGWTNVSGLSFLSHISRVKLCLPTPPPNSPTPSWAHRIPYAFWLRSVGLKHNLCCIFSPRLFQRVSLKGDWPGDLGWWGEGGLLGGWKESVTLPGTKCAVYIGGLLASSQSLPWVFTAGWTLEFLSTHGELGFLSRYCLGSGAGCFKAVPWCLMQVLSLITPTLGFQVYLSQPGCGR